MRKFFSTVVLFLTAALFVQAASAQATDFENFALGSPNGQFGWSSTGSAGSGCAVYDQVIDNTAFPNAPSSFGAKSLRISNAVTSGCFGDHTFSASTTNEAGESTATNGGMSGGTRQNFYQFSVDFASATGTYQPGLSVVLSPDRGDGARMSWVQIADAADGLQLNFNDVQNGNFVQTNIASGLPRTGAYTLKVTMQFVEGASNDIVKVYLNGALIHVGTSWEDYFRLYEAGNTTRTVDSVLFRTGGAAAPSNAGNGILFDNFNVSTGTVATAANQCKNGGWMTLVDQNGNPFRNQGQCVSSTVGNN